MKTIHQESFNFPSFSNISNDQLKLSETLETFSNYGQNNHLDCNSTPNSIVPIQKQINQELEQNNLQNRGHWTFEEHNTYMQFLEKHHDTTMQNQQNRKNNKIFKLMSEIIITRSPSQCRYNNKRQLINRSHHQKFNPYTSAGQKRIKKNKKKWNTQTQIKLNKTIQITQYFSPELRPNQELLPSIQDQEEQQDYLCVDSQILRIRKYSQDNLENSYHFNNPHNNLFINEFCYD